MPFFDVAALKEWFQKERRSLPWRDDPSPYEVWVSEIMLQQTQAAVVIPYYQRWMERFPTIQSLAQAPIEELVKMWEGLGYYSRVRNLHKAACHLLREKGGDLPQTAEELGKIPGIGPYTQGAILSFAFHQKRAAVDGNVLRVLSRYFLIEEEIEKAKKRITELTESILPDVEPWVVMEGLIELGAQVCRKKPLCEECPLRGSCLARLHKKEGVIPIKKKKEKATLLRRAVAILACQEELLVGKVMGKQVMADLYEFPYIEFEEYEEGVLHTKLEKELKMPIHVIRTLTPVKHTFTRYVATLYPLLATTKKRSSFKNYEWVKFEKLFTLPFSSGHRRILQEISRADFTH